MFARIIVFIFTIGFGFLPLQLQAQTVLDTVCAGAQGETYSVANTSGSTYNWSLEGGTLVSGQGSSTITVDWGNDTGIFELNVREVNKRGCPGDIVRAFVWVSRGVEVSVVGPSSVCKGQPIILSASGAAKYTWSTGLTGNALTFIPTKDEKLSVIGESACGIDTAEFFIKVYNKPKAQASYSPTNPGPGDVVKLIYQGDSAQTIRWNIPNRQSVEGQQVEHKFSDTGEFSVELIAIDVRGCADTTVKKVRVIPDVHVYIPNAFTPNGDGINQTFEPVVSNVKNMKLRVMNRWGQMVYEGEGLDASWDGNYQGQIAPESIYVYLVEVEGLDGRKYVYDGTVQLIR